VVAQNIECNTSGASPTTGDVTGLINQLKGDGYSACDQTNDDCTTLVTGGTAGITVCGNQTQLYCQGVGDVVELIQTQCLSTEEIDGEYRVGGIYNGVAEGVWIDVINSADA
jgi:hypothetical protein